MDIPFHLMPLVYQVHRKGIHLEGAKALVYNFYWCCGDIPFSAEDMVLLRKHGYINKERFKYTLYNNQHGIAMNDSYRRKFQELLDYLKKEEKKKNWENFARRETEEQL